MLWWKQGSGWIFCLSKYSEFTSISCLSHNYRQLQKFQTFSRNTFPERFIHFFNSSFPNLHGSSEATCPTVPHFFYELDILSNLYFMRTTQAWKFPDSEVGSRSLKYVRIRYRFLARYNPFLCFWIQEHLGESLQINLQLKIKWLYQVSTAGTVHSLSIISSALPS